MYFFNPLPISKPNSSLYTFFIIISMNQLKDYKRIIQIRCLSIQQGQNPTHNFEVKFQQPSPHSLFKYSINKTRDEVMRLFERLEGEIFDFDNPFSQSILANLTKPAVKPVQQLNEALEECTGRLDVLIHHHFLYFFSIHVHYPDFVACLKEELLALDLCAKGASKIDPKERKPGFDLEKGWSKPIPKGLPQKLPEQPKQIKEVLDFESLINLLHYEEDERIQVQNRRIIDFTYIRYYESSFLIVLEQQKKGKISGFIKTFFNDPRPLGWLSIHRREAGHYLRKFETNLQAEPQSMELNKKTNMIMTLTTVGVYVHLLKMQQKEESITLFAFIPLVGVAGIANNCHLGEVYLVRKVSPFKLYVYSLKEEQLKDAQYQYKNAASICFEEENSRLFVSDQTGIFIYAIAGGQDIKRLHFLKTQQSYISLSTTLGYLYCITPSGSLTVVQLKPPTKEQLMSVTTTIAIPANTKKIVGSKSRRMIVSCFKECVVLIDTIEGPLNSYKLKGHGEIKAIVYDPEGQRLLVMTENGGLVTISINKRFQ